MQVSAPLMLALIRKRDSSEYSHLIKLRCRIVELTTYNLGVG